jgi:hypothetical protein
LTFENECVGGEEEVEQSIYKCQCLTQKSEANQNLQMKDM